MKRIFSGIQPSGTLHLGNYLGAIAQFVEMQDKYDSIFSIVDYHAITVPQDPKKLNQHILETAASYLAAGIDPKKAILFQQSRIPEHTELGWIFNCITTMGELERMTQYKDKSSKKKTVTVGLFDYPNLMAADILLYDTDIVPVGEDQVQHVELARDIAERFNHKYGKTFVVPEAKLRPVGARIMSLDNPYNKMSKSAESAKSYIALTDSPDVIKKKIMSAVTDSGTDIKHGNKRPAITNLMIIYSLLSGKTFKEIEKTYEGKGYADFKSDLAEIIITSLDPIQKNYKQIIDERDMIKGVLDYGADQARTIAEETMRQVREKIGMTI